jgi:prepilin-type N-terminal cleavage/methylation domain-containing protein
LKQSGFTLIEVLVAMALVSFLLAGMGELLLHSLQAKRKTDTRLELTALLSAKLENLKTLPFDDTELQAGSHRLDIASVARLGEVREEWQIESLSLSAKKIDLQIIAGQKQDRAVRAVLLLSGHLGF